MWADKVKDYDNIVGIGKVTQSGNIADVDVYVKL